MSKPIWEIDNKELYAAMAIYWGLILLTMWLFSD